jgi:hypothetical protein
MKSKFLKSKISSHWKKNKKNIIIWSVKGLRSAQQVSSSSQGVHLL